MNCKHCNAELNENANFCSVCGKPVNEPEQVETPVDETPVQENSPVEEPAQENTVEETPVQDDSIEDVPAQETMAGPEIVEKKTGAGKIALAVAAVVVILAVLIAVIISGMNGNESEGTESTGSTQSTEEVVATIPADGNPDDVTCKGSYTAEDDVVIAAGDTVVATMGGKELTLSQLQVYYWLEVVYFLQDYSVYASYLGMDYTQPLDTQVCAMTEEQMTWQQYFLACALDSWTSYQAMALEAEANGLEMDADMREAMDGLLDSLNATAAEYEMADAEELIRSNFGAGATVQSYTDFWEVYYNGYTYYNYAYEQIQLTAEDVEAYFAENETSYSESGITKETEYKNVRHILIMVEGGTTDDDGNTTYSDEEWETCRSEAQGILDQWLAGDMTEDSFAELANTYSEDTGSNTNGGLYENVYEGEMVTAFNDWCFDETRKTGDYGMVQTEYGYHIMYFVSDVENVWYTTAESDLLYEKSSALTPAAVEKYPVEIDYSSILLSYINLGGE